MQEYKLPNGRDYDEPIKKYYLEMQQSKGRDTTEAFKDKTIEGIISAVRNDLIEVLGITDELVSRWKELEIPREEAIEEGMHPTSFEHFFSAFPREVLQSAAKDDKIKSRLIELYQSLLDRNEVGEFAQIGLDAIGASTLLDPRWDDKKLVKIIGTFTRNVIRAIGSENLALLSDSKIEIIEHLVIDEFNEDDVPKVLEKIGPVSLLSMSEEQLAQRIKEIERELHQEN